MNIRLFLTSVLITVAAVVVSSPATAGRSTTADHQAIAQPYERINVIGETSSAGVYDPTVEYNSDGSLGYLIYSGLERAPGGDLVNIKYIHTHLARTKDNGKTWSFVKRLNESASDTVESPVFSKLYRLGNTAIRGTWQHEVPTLVYDPGDRGREWKLLWHKYFSADMPSGRKRPRVFSHSWIMLKQAASPEALDDAEEIKLFGTRTATTPARFSFQNSIGKTADISTYTEPASLYYNERLYVALSYFEMPFRHELVLVSSRDHGKTWTHIGSPFSDRDPQDLEKNYKHFTGVALAEEDGKAFLLASPIHAKHGYQGTFIFEFENIDRAQLKRNAQGNLIVKKHLKRSLRGNFNAGQSDYHKYNTHGGVIFPQADLDSAPKIAQIFNTNERIEE